MITNADREKLYRAGYRVRGWEGQKAGLRRASALLADALNNPAPSMSALGRVGVSFSWWQRMKIKFFLWPNWRNDWEQAVIRRNRE